MTKELVKSIEVFNKRNNKDMASAVTEMNEVLEKINNELLRVIKRKEEAQFNVDELKDKLGLSSIDVLTVEDDTKRKDFLGRKRKLKEQLEEEELYLHINIDAYRVKLVKESNLEELKAKAQNENRTMTTVYNEHIDMVKDYLKAVENERNTKVGMGGSYSSAMRRYDHHTKKITEYKRRQEAREQKLKAVE